MAGVGDDVRSVDTGLNTRPRRATSPRRITPQEYANSVNAHSKQSSDTTLFPGIHYENLARYLSIPFDRQNARRSPVQRPDTATSSFPFAILYNLGDGRQISRFSSPEAVLASLETVHSGNESDSGTDLHQRLVFLRGQPSPEWLCHAGAAFLIDPEYFQRHLDFRAALGRHDYFVYPSIPSSSAASISLRFVTLGQWESPISRPKASKVEEFREAGRKAMKEYVHNLNQNFVNANPQTLGNSLIRDFHVYDNTHFAIEQAMSIAMIRQGKSWTVVVWSDSGKPISENDEGPWVTGVDPDNAQQPRLYPTIQRRPYIALKPHSFSLTSDSEPSRRLKQSSLLLHLDYGKDLDGDVMAQDPFYTLTELFQFCANSESQYLNLVEANLLAETSGAHQPTATHEPPNLLYIQEILKSHSNRIRENLDIIKLRGGSNWPRSSEPSIEQRASAAAHSLRRDFEYLLARLERLSGLCEARMNLLLNEAMFTASNKAIEEARVITKLTRLAYFYIPLSFTSSIFGMNLSPLVHDAPNSFWLWAVVSIPVLLLSLAFMFWKVRDILDSFRLFIKSKLTRQHGGGSKV